MPLLAFFSTEHNGWLTLPGKREDGYAWFARYFSHSPNFVASMAPSGSWGGDYMKFRPFQISYILFSRFSNASSSK